MTLVFLLRLFWLSIQQHFLPIKICHVFFFKKSHSLQTSNRLEVRDFPIQLAPVAPMLADPNGEKSPSLSTKIVVLFNKFQVMGVCLCKAPAKNMTWLKDAQKSIEKRSEYVPSHFVWDRKLLVLMAAIKDIPVLTFLGMFSHYRHFQKCGVVRPGKNFSRGCVAVWWWWDVADSEGHFSKSSDLLKSLLILDFIRCGGFVSKASVWSSHQRTREISWDGKAVSKLRTWG